MKEKKTIKAIFIEVHESLHREIKARSLIKNLTIKQWVLQAVLEAIAKEKHYE